MHSRIAMLCLSPIHEIEHPQLVLNHVFAALTPGGRLVIVEPAHSESGILEATVIGDELRDAGFTIVSLQNDYLIQPHRGSWWRIVAAKPDVARQ